MLYGAEVAVCSEINTEQMNIVWEERRILKCYMCWCRKAV